MMDYDNFMELYEAVYFFDRINNFIAGKIENPINLVELENIGINEAIYKAVVRILVVNHLLYYDNNKFTLSKEQKEKHQHILNNIIKSRKDEHCLNLFNSATNESTFFFNCINDLEYDIYSRYNFSITYNIGTLVAKYLDLNNKKVLELGGNSGGLGTALSRFYNNCLYTIVDKKIPCSVGKELSKMYDSNIVFVEGDVFDLRLSNQSYDCIMMMNLLHDFDDTKSLNILKNCMKYRSKETRLIVIEDILLSEFEPKEAIMHGLRLSANCKGGKQRTICEMEKLFAAFNYEVERVIRLDRIHTMMIMKL